MARNYLLARGMELRLRFFRVLMCIFVVLFCVVLDYPHYITLMAFIQDPAHNFYVYFLQQILLHLSYTLEQIRCSFYNISHIHLSNVVIITTI